VLSTGTITLKFGLGWSHSCQISSQSVQGFRSSEFWHSEFCHYSQSVWSPLQQCKHYHATSRCNSRKTAKAFCLSKF